MPPSDALPHEGPAYLRYRALFATQDGKEESDAALELFVKAKYFSYDEIELSYACRLQADETIMSQLRDEITFEECRRRHIANSRRCLTGGGTLAPMTTLAREDKERYSKACDEYKKTHAADADDTPTVPFNGPAYQRFRATLLTDEEKLENDRRVAQARQIYSDEQIERSYAFQWEEDEDFRAAKRGDISIEEFQKRNHDESKDSPKAQPIQTILSAILWEEYEAYMALHPNRFRTRVSGPRSRKAPLTRNPFNQGDELVAECERGGCNEALAPILRW